MELSAVSVAVANKGTLKLISMKNCIGYTKILFLFLPVFGGNLCS
jgi:hypothetical protein